MPSPRKKTTSPKKAAASGANGAKGGRPTRRFITGTLFEKYTTPVLIEGELYPYKIGYFLSDGTTLSVPHKEDPSPPPPTIDWDRPLAEQGFRFGVGGAGRGRITGARGRRPKT